MDQNIAEEEIYVNGSRKAIISLRCHPELKEKLIRESRSLGITVSERVENILLNTDQLNVEKEKCESVIAQQKAGIIELEKNINECKQQFTVESNRLNLEIGQLKMELISRENERSLLKDKRLLELFEKLKGKRDAILGTNGQQMSIIYNEPIDLLRVMIYSFKLKNS